MHVSLERVLEEIKHIPTYLVMGATGGTGKHFLPIVLGEGHCVKALVRNPAKLALQDAKLQVQKGSITDAAWDFAKLVEGDDFVIFNFTWDGVVRLRAHLRISCGETP